MQAFTLHRIALHVMVFALLALTPCCLYAQTATRIATSSQAPEPLPKADSSSTPAKRSPAVIGRPTIDPQMMAELPMSCVQSWEQLDLPENDRPVIDQTDNMNPQLRAILGAASVANPSSASIQQNPFFAPASPRRIGVQPVSRRTLAEGALNGNDRPANDDDLLAGDDEELLPAPNPARSDASGPASTETKSNGVQTGKPKPLGKGPGDSNDEDPLSGMGPAVGGIKSKPLEPLSPHSANTPATGPTDPLEQLYPSAQTCAKCHPKQYDEWRVSAHAYSYVSPTFHRFEQAMQDLTQGTVGSFCVRCHSPVGTQLCIPPSTSLLDVPPIVREGITCVACHRVQEAVWRTHGDRRIEPGDIHAPIVGGSDGTGVNAARADAAQLKLKLSPDEPGPGQPMHRHCGPFEPIRKSDFCASCHQVAVHPGIWLEIVHAQYRSGPANAKGITCQQCHMGSIPGKPDGYEASHWPRCKQTLWRAKEAFQSHVLGSWLFHRSPRDFSSQQGRCEIRATRLAQLRLSSWLGYEGV